MLSASSASSSTWYLFHGTPFTGSDDDDDESLALPPSVVVVVLVLLKGLSPRRAFLRLLPRRASTSLKELEIMSPRISGTSSSSSRERLDEVELPLECEREREVCFG